MTRVKFALGALLCVLISNSSAQNPAPEKLAYTPPLLTFEVNQSEAVLRGAVSSVAHESILRQRALTLFPKQRRTYSLRQRSDLPPGWALISELGLRAVAESFSSTTRISPTEMSIAGVASSDSAWHTRVEQVQKNLLPGMRLNIQMSEIGALDSHAEQCTALLKHAMSLQRIEFPRSGTVLSSSAYPLLDRVVQIATDCPQTSLQIKGHTDTTGDGPSNQFISEARAGAVAEYLIDHGIAAERVASSGLGSTQPLRSGTSRQDQKLNRRIEIEFVFPER